MISCISAADGNQIDFGPYRNAYWGDPCGMSHLGRDTGYEDGLLDNPHRVTSCASRRALDLILFSLGFPFTIMGNAYSHGYEDGYEFGVSDRNKGIVDPQTRKVIYCRTSKQIEKQQAPVAKPGEINTAVKKPVLPDPEKAGDARCAWLFSEVATLGGAVVGSFALDPLRENCSFKMLCLLSAAASYPALKEARTQLAVAFPSTHPRSISIPLTGGRTYEVKNPLEKALGLLGATYFLSKAWDGAGAPDELFTNFAKVSLIGASGYAARKLVEGAYRVKISREE